MPQKTVNISDESDEECETESKRKKAAGSDRRARTKQVKYAFSDEEDESDDWQISNESDSDFWLSCKSCQKKFSLLNVLSFMLPLVQYVWIVCVHNYVSFEGIIDSLAEPVLCYIQLTLY